MTAINSNRAIRGPVTAVPVVAGKGVRLVADTETNRWVVEADETVLFENASGATTVNLSESIYNFERVAVVVKTDETPANVELLFSSIGSKIQTQIWYTNATGDYDVCAFAHYAISNNGTTLTGSNFKHIWFNMYTQIFNPEGSGGDGPKIVQVRGINRVSGGN